MYIDREGPSDAVESCVKLHLSGWAFRGRRFEKRPWGPTKQEGRVRSSYLPTGSNTPRHDQCLTEAPLGPPPIFFRFATAPAYVKLLPSTADAVRRGADHGGEMGAFHFVLAPLRETTCAGCRNTARRDGVRDQFTRPDKGFRHELRQQPVLLQPMERLFRRCHVAGRRPVGLRLERVARDIEPSHPGGTMDTFGRAAYPLTTPYGFSSGRSLMRTASSMSRNSRSAN